MATVRAAGDGFSAEVVNQRFTVLPLCYELTTLLRIIFIYVTVRSYRAATPTRGAPTGPYPLVHGSTTTSHVINVMPPWHRSELMVRAQYG